MYAAMSGSRDPCNILLESNCTFHDEACNDAYKSQHISLPHQNIRYSSERNATQDMTNNPLHRDDTKSACATPNENYSRRHGDRSTEYSDQYLPQRQPVDSQIKGVPMVDNYHVEQFKQGIAENIQKRGGSYTSHDDYSWPDIENYGKCRNKENRCSREKPRGTPFSCNDCMEPQCLYCWRKLREASGDFSFLDGFETQEPTWKPGKKCVDQFNNCSVEPNQNGSRRSILLEDRVHPGNLKLKRNTCQPSYYEEEPQPSHFEEEPQWKPADSFHANNGSNEPKEQQNARCALPFRDNEWQWPLGKGRGMGPGPGEWLPPFRNHSSSLENGHSLPLFQRSKGVGKLPNLDDWVPPFRGEEQPYNWHRCKGSGGCPPRDQWLAPWCNSNGKDQVDPCSGQR